MKPEVIMALLNDAVLAAPNQGLYRVESETGCPPFTGVVQ